MLEGLVYGTRVPVQPTHRDPARVATLLVSAFLLSSCASGPRPCVGPSACGAGYECLANTCVRTGGEPVSPSNERVALEPTRWQVLSPDRDDDGASSSVHFGGATADVYLLDFELPALPPEKLSRAFLIVAPLPDAAQGSSDARVSAWRIVERWEAGDVGYVQQPKADRPSAAGIARAPLPLRIDVTELVRRWLENHGTTHGIVLKSGSGPGQPQVYATGLGPGRAPVLEIYFESKPPGGAQLEAGGS